MIQADEQYIIGYLDRSLDFWNRFPKETKFMAEALNHVSGKSVLNIGCGPQFYFYSNFFESTPSLYFGIDISEVTISILKKKNYKEVFAQAKRCQAESMKVELHSGDFLKHEFGQTVQFDTILSVGFIGIFHGSQLRCVLEKTHSLLKTGGHLVKITWHGPHRTPEEQAKKLEFGFDSEEEHTAQSLDAEIVGAGFSIQNSRTMAPHPDYEWDVIHTGVYEKR